MARATAAASTPRRRPGVRAFTLVAAVGMLAACGASEGVRQEIAARNASAGGPVASGLESHGDAGPIAGPADHSPGASDDGGPDESAAVGGEQTTAAAEDSAGPASPTEEAGGNDPAAAPVEGNGGATDVGVSEGTIKIGGTFFNGGFLDKYSQVSQQAAQAYFNFVNDQGGIHGRKIQYIPCDTAGQAQGTASCLNKFLQSDNVFAIGPSLDFNLDTVQPTIESAGVPWVGSSGLYLEEFQSPMMFPTQLKGADVGAMILTFAAQDLGAKTVGVSWVTIGAGPDCFDRVKQLAPELGVEVIVNAVNEDVNNGLTSQVATISDKNPDAVLFCNDPVNTVKFIQAAGSRGYKPPSGFIGGFVAADDVPEAMGRAGVGVYGFSSYDFYKSDSEEVARFREITEFYYPRTFHHFYTQAAYTGAVALVEALRAAGPNLTRERFIEAMQGLTVDSMGQTINFGNLNSRASGIMLQANNNLQWEQVKDRFQAAG